MVERLLGEGVVAGVVTREYADRMLLVGNDGKTGSGRAVPGVGHHDVVPTPLPERPRLRVAGLVLAGGCAGGLLRYAAGAAWPEPRGGLPVATLVVNTAGALVLGAVVTVAGQLPGRWLRPLLGTGFCGALTTFSAVVVAADRLLADGRPALAAAYLAATTGAGLAAVALGAAAGRAVVRRC